MNRFLPSLYGAWLSEHRSSPVAGRNNTVAAPGLSCPNPITRPFDPDPDLASPWTFSNGLW
ncbi:MAG: hypothetical protein PHF14_01445, partial [Verrucomicrobiota bacterium]|nr:hypothetical protein [Verrucomicrobiota bacterium]